MMDTIVAVGDLIKVDTNVSDNVKRIKKNILAASVLIMDETLVIPRRSWKPTTVHESPFLLKFNFDGSNVEGQPSKCIKNGPLSKRLLSIKNPFVKSIT